MKRLIITLSLIAFNQLLNAQTDLYQKVLQLIKETHPELSTENKLIALNTWSIKDANSREANKGFEKAFATYADGRLKGGRKGIIVITANENNLSSSAVITLQKDGVTKSISIKADDLEGIALPLNVVFDSNGAVVYKDLAPASVFKSIHNLVTR